MGRLIGCLRKCDASAWPSVSPGRREWVCRVSSSESQTRMATPRTHKHRQQQATQAVPGSHSQVDDRALRQRRRVAVASV